MQKVQKMMESDKKFKNDANNRFKLMQDVKSSISKKILNSPESTKKPHS